MAQVDVIGVQKRYGPVTAIHGVDIEISDGEFVVLVGPSGCGKSTLLRMIAGLEDISGGDILIDGRVVNDVPPRERDIAMVFQNYALYPHMTVRQNMAFSLRLSRASRAEVDEKVGRASGILGLDALLDRKPAQLSGGQRQRVAMGRAIVRDPKVFLFDEPLSNLDAKLRVQMRTEIKSLHQRLGTTTIYVTHDQIEAMTMADKIVVMRDGIIEQIGSPLELYDNPANLFVAQFIGSPAMNVLECTWTGEALNTADGQTLLRVPVLSIAPGTPLAFGVRPEHLRLSDRGLGFDAKIEVVEPTGAETQVFARIGEQPVVAVLRERTSFRPGEIIQLEADATAIHLFHDGKRLSRSQ